jgi:hypothetical protein
VGNLKADSVSPASAHFPNIIVGSRIFEQVNAAIDHDEV